MVKPCVVGTTARASSENVRSIGYSIYYTLVSVGATLGPVVAWLVRKQLGWGMENVFRVSALSVFLMFLVTMGFFHDPGHSGEQKVTSVAEAIRNMFVVLRNFRFVLFLLIYSSFYIVYLAGIHFGAIVFAGLRGPERQCRSAALHRRAHDLLLPDSGNLFDPQDSNLFGD